MLTYTPQLPSSCSSTRDICSVLLAWIVWRGLDAASTPVPGATTPGVAGRQRRSCFRVAVTGVFLASRSSGSRRDIRSAAGFRQLRSWHVVVSHPRRFDNKVVLPVGILCTRRRDTLTPLGCTYCCASCIICSIIFPLVFPWVGLKTGD